jgi:hypothetical protein
MTPSIAAEIFRTILERSKDPERREDARRKLEELVREFGEEATRRA